MPKILLPVAALAMLVGSARVSTVGLRLVFVVSKPTRRFGSRSAAPLYNASPLDGIVLLAVAAR